MRIEKKDVFRVYGCSLFHHTRNILEDIENVIRNHACFTGASLGNVVGFHSWVQADKEVH